MKIKILICALCVSSFVFASKESICGVDDNRVSSFDSKIGRLSKVNALSGELSHKGCTVTLVSDKCGVTAGHCESVFDAAEFNTPLSDSKGNPKAAKAEDVYLIKRYKSQNNRSLFVPRKDWAVVEFEANKMTGKLPGEAYGYYDVDLSIAKVGARVSITGYGVDKNDLEKNFTQQTHEGKITKKSWWFPYFYYNIDTMPGNSGAAVIDVKSQKIIGIHTNGGCFRHGGSNKGQYTRKIAKFKKALNECLNR